VTAAAPPAVRVLERDDPAFPKSLLVVQPQPERLYALGDVSLLARDLVGIVGSRTPTPYGLRVAYAAAQAAARAGLVVVSGLARGLDARGHRGALDAGGKTVAVLGSGVDVAYPKSNRDLYDDILRSGLLLSEQEPGTDPLPGSFPKRNRLIAGLARCLLVVEGRITGGTRITSRLMLDMGKLVLAVPGRLEDEVAGGPNRLLQEGATIYLGPDDLLRPFGLKWNAVEQKERKAAADAIGDLFSSESSLLAAEARVFDLLGAEPLHVDAIAERTRLDAGTLLAALSSLELKGLAEQLPGKHFRLAA